MGHEVAARSPQGGGPPPTGPQYGPSYFSSPGGFTDAYNFSTGCHAASDKPLDCDGAMR